jgi:hypothetical protein
VLEVVDVGSAVEGWTPPDSYDHPYPEGTETVVPPPLPPPPPPELTADVVKVLSPDVVEVPVTAEVTAK